MADKNIAQILVGIDSNTVLLGARQIKTKLITELSRQGLSDEVRVIETGSIGPTNMGLVLGVFPGGELYANITEDDVEEFVQERFVKGRIYRKKLLTETLPEQLRLLEYDSRKTQYYGRIVLDNCGRIDPEDITEYIGVGGYEALGYALKEKSPEEIINIVQDSGLRGRGGAGFPTGLKWSFTFREKRYPKYVICNADEGEPGTFKDRLIMEGDPHKIIEAMTIAGYAIEAETGYIYIRGEYKLSVERLQKAIAQAKEMGFLGQNIFGSDFNFDIQIKIGAGSYVCGEETALLNSMEGYRGEPRLKPPYPAQYGFKQLPTLINNVETLANIPAIILNGSQWFRHFGTENMPGTKVYTVLGHVRRPGLIEVPIGITLREIIYDYAGGISSGTFKMAQIGGTAGDILPEQLLDVPLECQSLQELGHNLGSGALLIMNDTVSVTDFLKSCMKFFVHESCGKCSVCRIGTGYLYEACDRLNKKEGYSDELKNMRDIATTLKLTAFCPLGQSVAQPVLSALKYFEEELKEGSNPNKKSKLVTREKSEKVFYYS
jgi:NADH:ubiquinone oxidoreductase subunit F (NADH-binding)/(2Fe-2S) ferredoxin